MGLLQNGFRDTCGVFRTYGGTISNNCYPQGALGNYNLTGANRNLTAGEGITDAKVGIPLGYVMRGWQMPQKAGMISARVNDIAITGNRVGRRCDRARRAALAGTCRNGQSSWASHRVTRIGGRQYQANPFWRPCSHMATSTLVPHWV